LPLICLPPGTGLLQSMSLRGGPFPPRNGLPSPTRHDSLKSGDFIRVTDAGFIFFFEIKDYQGEIRAHRSYPLVEDDEGCLKVPACKYHGKFG
jgi:hypothetical protein